MTLILALANQEYVIQLSDRRLSSDGRLVDEESNKVACITTDDSRMLVGFSGLAKCGSFKTRNWILDTLFNLKSHAIYDVFEEFKTNATKYFNSNGLLRKIPREDKRLSIMFTGYVGPWLIGNCIITNYQDFNSGIDSSKCFDEFHSYPTISKKDPLVAGTCTFVQRIGAWSAMTGDDEETLRSMLRDKKPRKAIVAKAVSLIREMSDRRESSGVIGKQINSACLERGSLTPICEYHTTELKNHLYLPDMIDLTTSTPTLAIREVKLGVPGPPIFGNKVGRNQRCPCGSGKKFKRCHGKRG